MPQGIRNHFTVDARAVVALGAENIKDPVTAVLELVKNAYDADASVVEIEVGQSSIFVRDNGHGMTDDDITFKWLRIGYSEKKKNSISPKGRRKTGEKGIGRIAADRLGAKFTLKTQPQDAKSVGVAVDWSQFYQEDLDINNVKVKRVNNPKFKIPKGFQSTATLLRSSESKRHHNNSPDKHTGTELHIEELRQPWTGDMLQSLKKALSSFVPPIRVHDFQIQVLAAELDGTNEVVESQAAEDAMVRLECELKPDKSVSIKKTIFEIDAPEIETSWAEFMQVKDEEFASLGPLKILLLYYPQVQEAVRGSFLKIQDIQKFMSTHHGIKIYRDNIRVMPYGEVGRPEEDWLGLGLRRTRNPAGRGRASHRIGPNQLVGYVFVERNTNPLLQDSTAREGLVSNASFELMKKFGLRAIKELEIIAHELESKKKAQATAGVTVQEMRALAEDLKELTSKLEDVKTKVPKETKKFIEETSEKLHSHAQTYEDILEQNSMFRGLASIGVAATTFSHETLTHLQRVIVPINNACNFLRKNIEPESPVELALRRAGSDVEYVESWARFALARITKDKRKRKKIDVGKVMKKLLNDMRPIIEATGVEIEEHIASIETFAFPADIESVTVNLMTNAYYFCKKGSRRRKIRAELRQRQSVAGESGYSIVVADSGPGVRVDLKDQIWSPLFSTKHESDHSSIGSGLGLAIVDTIVQDAKGARTVSRDKDLKGALFEIWFPLSVRGNK